MGNYIELLVKSEERRKALNYSFRERMKITDKIIRTYLSLAKYPVIQFSGGIDSCFMAYLIHKINPNVPCVFNDWGLFFPEQEEFCINFFKNYNFKYYISRSNWDYKRFFKKYGFPIFKGVRQFINSKDYPKYNITTKCRMLKHSAWRNFLKEHKCDYYFVGILADESPQRKALFTGYGFVSAKKGEPTRVKPIVLIKKEEIFKYCNEKNILYPKEFYKDSYKGKTFYYTHCDLGCYICTPRFKEEGYGRLGRNTRKNPILLKETLEMGLRDSLEKIIKDYPEESWYIKNYLEEYDKIEEPITAYDLDGVIMPLIKRDKKYFEQSGIERKLFEEQKKKHFINSPITLRPIEREFYIISSRREKYRNTTEEWLKKKKVNYKRLILMEGELTFKHIVEHKYKWLKELGVRRYYEDDEKIIKELRRMLPNVEFVNIKQPVIVQEVVENKKNILTFF